MSFILDRLPTELSHLIFEYFWAHEILHSFGNISSYLNNILINYHNYMINFESIRKSHFDLVCRYLRPQQVISLILCDEKQTPNLPEIFLSLFSIEEFLNLRVLKLIQLKEEHESLFIVLHKLPRLVSLKVDMSIHLHSITNPPSLKQLIINTPKNIQLNIDPSIELVRFEHLHYLSLSTCSSEMLEKILRQAVRLKTLNISFTFYNENEFDGFVKFHREQTIIYPLVSLSLSLNGGGRIIKRVHVERFLIPFRRLQQLKLVIPFSAQGEIFEAYQWEKFVTQHLPELLRFNFNFAFGRFDQTIVDQYRHPFWLDKHWYVASNSDYSSLLTVPYFVSTSTDCSCLPMSPELTTLPIDQHQIFYDRVTSLRYDSDRCKLPHRYNYVEKLFIESPYVEENILDLSKVQSLNIDASQWSFRALALLIKRSMPLVNCLTLTCTYQDFPNVSLEQIRRLWLPEFGHVKDYHLLPWHKVFPCVERLSVSIHSKKQIPFLIDHFKSMVSGHFNIDMALMNRNKPIHMTHQWLVKHTDRLREDINKNFVCEINRRYIFTVDIWIGETSSNA